MDKTMKMTEERILQTLPGMGMLFLGIALLLVCWVPAAAAFYLDIFIFPGLLLSGLVLLLGCLLFCGLRVIRPNEALVLTLFGNYHGTLYQPGFHWVNPFCTAINPTAEQKDTPTATTGNLALGSSHTEIKLTPKRKSISLRTMTLNNKKQKVNDQLGNPIEIGIVVIWKVTNATKAVLCVENYVEYLSIQCDAVTRNAARNYPYDSGDETGKRTLRGSSQEIASLMQEELQQRVVDAGIEILDVRITNLAYAPEIASAMLQRQQAAAIIDARQKIVEGAVGMVEMALSQLSESQIVELDEERKAAMVSNLLVILCGNKDPQPVVNSGSLY